MKIIFLFTILSTLVMGSITAQDRVFTRGLVKDRFSGEPLIGANIICPQTGKGTSTDVHGRFSIETTPGKELLIQVSFVGYESISLKIIPDNINNLQIELEPGIIIDEINVNAVRRIEDRIEIGAVEIPIQQIKNLPMIGEPDVLKALQLLPGIQGGSDAQSGLYVRGGSPDQNLFMLDGTPIYYVNHLGGFVSVFHTDILKNVKLYKGGFPARFGGRLSSVVDLRMKEGNKKEHHGSWGVGVVSGDLTLEGPIDQKTSYIVSLRRMWIDFLMRPATKIAFQQASMGYNFYDFFGKITHEANPNNRYYLSLYSGDDHLGFNFNLKDADSKGYSKYVWGNILGTYRWNHIYNPKLSSDVTFFYTRYRYKLNQTNNVGDDKDQRIYTTGVHDFGLKADYDWYLGDKYTLRFGGGLSGNWFKPGEILSEKVNKDGTTKTVIGAQNQTNALNTYLYLENEIDVLPCLTINAGLRLVNFRVDRKDYLSTEPRLMAAFKLKHSGAIQLAFSQMQQPVHLLTYSGSTLPTDIWIPSNGNIKPGRAKQLSLGFVKSLEEGKYELSAEIYYKWLINLLEIKGGVPLVNTNKWENNVEKEGTGNAKGFEFMIQKKQGKTTGWISYTLAKNDRQFDRINNGNPYVFKYDRRHDVSVVFSHKFSEKIDFSATWVFGSGYPTTLQNGIYQTIELYKRVIEAPNQGSFDFSGEAYLYPEKNGLRMRAYHRLDLGVNFNKQKGNKIRTWTIGIYNAYNRQNAVFYYYGHRNQRQSEPIVLLQQSGFPIIPTVKYSVKF